MTTAQDLYQALGHIQIGGSTCLFTQEKCEALAPLIDRIKTLKAQKNAVLLAHSYVSPEILYIADFVGDSYELSKKAQTTTADTIVFSAVKFMAETAKILNPTKTVLVPSKNNGCTLADSITAQQVRDLKKAHPDYTFVCYINTTAEVKAECEVCVTSSNCVSIVSKIPNDKIFFLPDKLMAQNIQNQLRQEGVEKTLKWSEGTCYVHEAYDPDMIAYLKLTHPGAVVLSHPECSPAVLSASDFVGSTSQMIDYVKKNLPPKVVMLTECGLSARLQMQVPEVQFIGSCTMCRYMKSNTLEDIIRVLESPDKEDCITLDPTVIQAAKKSIDAMFDYVETK
jgi:quinolinate synthase